MIRLHLKFSNSLVNLVVESTNAERNEIRNSISMPGSGLLVVFQPIYYFPATVCRE